jgi:hypothetical protein
MAPCFFRHFSSSSSTARSAGVGIGCGVNGSDLSFHRVSVLAGQESEGVPDQVNDAGLGNGLRPDIGDDVGKTFETVADEEEHVPDATVLQVDQHAHPELRALTAGAHPQTQYFLAAVHGDPEGGVDGSVGDLAVADFHQVDGWSTRSSPQ